MDSIAKEDNADFFFFNKSDKLLEYGRHARQPVIHIRSIDYCISRISRKYKISLMRKYKAHPIPIIIRLREAKKQECQLSENFLIKI